MIAFLRHTTIAARIVAVCAHRASPDSSVPVDQSPSQTVVHTRAPYRDSECISIVAREYPLISELAILAGRSGTCARKNNALAKALFPA